MLSWAQEEVARKKGGAAPAASTLSSGPIDVQAVEDGRQHRALRIEELIDTTTAIDSVEAKTRGKSTEAPTKAQGQIGTKIESESAETADPPTAKRSMSTVAQSLSSPLKRSRGAGNYNDETPSPFKGRTRRSYSKEEGEITPPSA